MNEHVKKCDYAIIGYYDGIPVYEKTIGRRKDKVKGYKVKGYDFAIAVLTVIIVVAVGVLAWNGPLNSKPLEKRMAESDAPALFWGLPIEGEGMFAGEFSDSKRINIVLIGNTDEDLIDVIMLLSISPETNDIFIISIPRDTYYSSEITPPSPGAKKINATYKYAGSGAAARAVHDVLCGIPVHFGAMVGYSGVEEVVDAMGGVRFDVPQDMYYYSPARILIDLQAGEQTLDGKQAMQFLRYRSGYEAGDLDRAAAQQAFMEAAVSQVFEDNKLKTISAIIENVDSNITVKAALKFSIMMIGPGDVNISMMTLPGETGRQNNTHYFFPAGQIEIEEALHSVYSK